ncbi:MAG: type I DNA topoisomerase, partial [Firmicutes bacterium]|nr:type I DNA topoisomerase [Bacillota bacterium]
ARKLNFTVKKTMRVAQQLYEGLNVGEGNVGLITYMRTDAVRVANEAVTEVRGLINEKFGTDFLPQKPRVYRSKSGAQEAHEAIRPTSVFRTPEELKTHLNRDQLRLYRLIWERFVASQMASAITYTVTVDITVQDYMFRASGSQIKFPGFIQVYVEGQDDTEKNSRTLPELKENEIVNLKDLNLKQHFTQPPPRYTEAMLVKTLEENGIGRPSTYAPIIDTNLRRGYVFLEDKRFKPTELGIIVVEILKENFAYLLDVDFTASMEQKLDEIEEGKANWVEIIDDFYQEFAKDLKKAHDELEKVEIQDEVSDVECSKCGAFMVIKWGRFGKFLACPNYPECKNTKSLLNEIGVK